MKTVIQLTDAQVLGAEHVGRKRNGTHEDRGHKGYPVHGRGKHGKANNDESVHEDGAVAELACAIALERDWVGKIFEDLDEWEEYIGTDIEGADVRSTWNRSGCLVLHDDDKPAVPYILAIRLHENWVRLVGWMHARDGIQAHYWDEGKPRPAYFVPQRDLEAMADLPPAQA